MKKITIFIGSARKRTTYEAVVEFAKNMKKYGEFEIEHVFLDDYNLGFCNGCKVCFDKGEEFCPLKDDRDVLIEKMARSDGVVFASPNYAFQVSARMKNLLDRCAFIYHRPRFFGKQLTVIVTQGLFGGREIRNFLENAGENFGFSVVKGSVVNTLEPMTVKRKAMLEKEIATLARRYSKALKRSELPAPSIVRLIGFRMTRTMLQWMRVKLRDYYYYRDKGWFDSEYYYNTHMNIFKKAIARFSDTCGRMIAKKI
jgi:multimeric flavodoxin WrbA